MATRRLTLELVPLHPPAGEATEPTSAYFGPKRHYLEIEVAYNQGGPNYFTGGTTARGYYLRMTPVWKQTSGGGEATGFVMFTGSALKLAEAKRFSAKVLAEMAEAAAANPVYASMKASVLAKHGRVPLTPAPAVDSMVT